MASGMVTLTLWPHPSMKVPFEFDEKAKSFTVEKKLRITELMETVEAAFVERSAANGTNLDLEISVLWNTRDHKKALNPNEKVGQHFQDGDVFGIHGDIGPRSEREPAQEESKVPVTVLTGFLGAGKTTLLNYILQEQHEKRIAVIENELGEVSIDDDLLKKGKKVLPERIITLGNGCMCCTIRGDLEEGLLSLLADIKKEGGIDAIILETTGLADPVPIVRTFMSKPELTKELRLDAVITMVDCKNLVGQLAEGISDGGVDIPYQQIAFADKILLNKLDLVTADEAVACKDRIRDINKFAKIVPSVKGHVDLSELSNMHRHNLFALAREDIEIEAAEPEIAKFGHDGSGAVKCHHHDENCDATCGSKAEGPRHGASVNSFSLTREGEVVARRLSAWMHMLGQFPDDLGVIYRIKAIFAIKGHPERRVFHAVMDISDEDDAGLWEEGEKKVSKIVFIGKNLKKAFLQKTWEDLFE